MNLRPVLTWSAGGAPPSCVRDSEGRVRVEDLDTGRFGWAHLAEPTWDGE